MATDLLWQRTQLGFEIPRLHNVAFHGYSGVHQIPQRHVDVGQAAAENHNNQLQFNLGIPSSSVDLATKFRKPRPIVIEKLNEQPSVQPELRLQAQNGLLGINRGSVSVSSSLASDRLALAVHLARRDVKKSREVSTGSAQVSQEQEAQERHREAPAKEQKCKERAAKKGKVRRSKRGSVMKEEEISLRERVQRAVKKQDWHSPAPLPQRYEATKRGSQCYFYPAREDEDMVLYESEGERKQAKEIRRLRGELNHYMKKVEELQQDKQPVLKNKDKRIKKRKQEDLRLSDEEEDLRQAARQEEQATRSARMLYTLQTQVQEIESELNKKKRGIKHTKKSQTLSRLAAAHRGAVRAIQTFISHAPLQTKISQGLPPTYQELALLIRQLSVLSARLQIGGHDVPDHPVLKPLETRGVKAPQDKLSDEHKPRKEAKQTPGSKWHSDEAFKHSRIDTHRADSPDPTPERDAVLKAGLAALLRAKATPLTPVVKPRLQRRLQQRQPLMPTKKSVLLPAKLKVERQKAQHALQTVKFVNMQQAHFAQETVSSKLRKAPPGPLPNGPQVAGQSKSPVTTPTKSVPFERHCCHVIDEMTQKTPRRKIEEQMESPRSPKSPRRMLPTDKEMVEREVERQWYLDREADRRLRELEQLRRMDHIRRGRESEGNALSRRLINEAEEAIQCKLKPLLDRAEAIVKEHEKTEVKAESLQRRLVQISSQTTMDQAGAISDRLLDELIEETVSEMQRLELEHEAEGTAVSLLASSTLENMLERLQSFEKVEEDIRRHWVHVQYADADGPRATAGSPDEHRRQTSLGTQSTGPQEPNPIVFTRPPGEPGQGRFLSDRIRNLRERDEGDRERSVHLTEQLLPPEQIEDASSLEDSCSVGAVEVHLTRSQPHSWNLHPRAQPPLSVFVPSSLRASIAAYMTRYEKYLRDTSAHVHGSFDPWGLVESISDEILEDLFKDVGSELLGVCDDYTEHIYSDEFAACNGDDTTDERESRAFDTKDDKKQ